MDIKINKSIPYNFSEDGYNWTLIAVKNDFSKAKTLIHCEYENQYGHLKVLLNNNECKIHDFQRESISRKVTCTQCGTEKKLVWQCKYCGENEKPRCHKCVREDGKSVSDELEV
jgi:hypothetical protein